MLCQYCRKIILKTSTRKVSHQNIAISKDPLWFCTKKCYEKWLAEINSQNIRTYFLWKVDKILNKIRFIKKIIQVKGMAYEYGPSTQDTHFAKDL